MANVFKVERDDIIALAKKGAFDVLFHDCNCFCKMDAGLAKAIRNVFPAAYKADQNTRRANRDKLGTCSMANVSHDGHSFVILNAYTQYDSKTKGKNVDYEALRSCLQYLKANYTGKRIGMPKVGATFGGGEWKKIFRIIREELEGENLRIFQY